MVLFVFVLLFPFAVKRGGIFFRKKSIQTFHFLTTILYLCSQQTHENKENIMLYNNKVCLTVFFLLLSAPMLWAQKSARNAPKTSEVVYETSKEELNYANLLPATARLTFIDSLVVNYDDIYDNLHIAPSCGKLKAEKADKSTTYIYTNDFGTLRYISKADAKGVHHLYSQQRIGRDWTNMEKVNLEGDFTDIICPYLMPDGVTLYFAARGGEDSVGDHDLFYTVFDTDSRTFYRPQSLGLPYNSMSDDVCCLIDDVNNLGHLVTTRNQKDGKACIYVFIPTESRETYDADMDIAKLSSFAAINAIKDTQTDANAVAQAKNRYAKLATDMSEEGGEDFTFVVSKDRIYHKISDFRSASNAEKFMNYNASLSELRQMETFLAELRKAYHNGDKSKSAQILELEKTVMKQRKALSALEKQIRNAEYLKQNYKN